MASRNPAGVFAFEMPTLDPRFAGLTNIGNPSRASSSAAISSPRCSQSRLQDDAIVADRKAARGEHDLHQRLVHSQSRGGDAGADVRHVGELEQALNRAVLAVWPVQDGEDDVEMQTGDRRLGRLGRRLRRALDRKDGLLARP